jgi:Ca2+-binding RTX toxin-like protein
MDAANGDRIKFDSAPEGAFGSIKLGDGSATARYVMEVQAKADGYTYLYFGTNDAPGADLTMKLLGSYGTGAFALANNGRDVNVLQASSTPGDDTLIGTSGNDILDGAAGNDKLYGKEGADALLGNLGNDTLVGGTGSDTLTGGEGADTFLYNLVGESLPGAINSDSITDFAHLVDKIDLRLIDADTATTGNQAFSFIANNEFSGVAGELRWENSADAAQPDVLQLDVNGDSVAEMEIVLPYSIAAITAADFYL